MLTLSLECALPPVLAIRMKPVVGLTGLTFGMPRTAQQATWGHLEMTAQSI